MKKLRIAKELFGFISVLSVVTLLSARPALAMPGDGLYFADCQGRYIIATRTWGVAKMYVYGCSNGYVFTHVNSASDWGKDARIARDNPYAYRYSSTAGTSKYAVTTQMLRYVRGTCYTAVGSSADSNYGNIVKVRWCY